MAKPDPRPSRRLKSLSVAHATHTVPDMGWQGRKNGELLPLASAEFDVFVTADQNLQYQQNLHGVDIGIIVLAAVTARLDDLRTLVPAALNAPRRSNEVATHPIWVA